MEEREGQADLPRDRQREDESEAEWQAGAWGDKFQKKKPNTVRVFLQNNGGLPVVDGKAKYMHLQHFIIQNNIDILALPECSVNWGKMEHAHRLPECTKGWWESVQWATAYHKLEEHPSKHQPGGTALAFINEMMHRAQWPGDNKVGLGRWCWGRL